MRHWRHRRRLYNRRSELAAATVGTDSYGYAYDSIGNRLWSAANAVTNSYTANSLNQYTSILCGSAPLRDVSHDADGNMTQYGDWTYTYDAANRLKTVSSNGVLLATNFYDAKSRRVRKTTSGYSTTFFYDDWNLIEERVAYTNGTTSAIRYYWGKDLSGTLQGAGGVGGLLYLTRDGTIYIPCYDNNGNVTRYLDASGNTVAQYTYDAFGNTIAKSGPLADFFRHRFSTKYYDIETGLYYYGLRYYSPVLRRMPLRGKIVHRKHTEIKLFRCSDGSVYTDKTQTVYKIINAASDNAGWDFEDSPRNNNVYLNVASLSGYSGCLRGTILIKATFQHYGSSFRVIGPMRRESDSLSGSLGSEPFPHGGISSYAGWPMTTGSYQGFSSLTVEIKLDCSSYEVKASGRGLDSANWAERKERGYEKIGREPYNDWYLQLH